MEYKMNTKRSAGKLRETKAYFEEALHYERKNINILPKLIGQERLF